MSGYGAGVSLWTEDPRAAAVYDAECVGRQDHDLYLALAAESPGSAVVDLGCGTGVLTVDLASAGHDATGVDPAQAMLDVARQRPGGGLVTWIHGSAADLTTDAADLVVMTGHVAQYFVEEAEWLGTLREIRRSLRPGGRVAFEARVPDRGWPDRWTPERTRRSYPHPDGGTFTSWTEVVEVIGPPTSFRMTHRGHTALPDGSTIAFDETLRYRSEAELRAGLAQTGLEIQALWGDWARGDLSADSDEIIIVATPTPSR